MQGDKPFGGDWNYDIENRKTYKGEVKIHEFLDFKHNYRDIENEIKIKDLQIKEQHLQTINQIEKGKSR